MKLLLLFIIGAMWGQFALWYIGVRSLGEVNTLQFLVGFVAIPCAIGVLFATAERLILSLRK